ELDPLVAVERKVDVVLDLGGRDHNVDLASPTRARADEMTVGEAHEVADPDWAVNQHLDDACRPDDWPFDQGCELRRREAHRPVHRRRPAEPPPAPARAASPVPSHTISFTRSARRARNTKIAPEYGSARSCSIGLIAASV